jgi:hypothetical protein
LAIGPLRFTVRVCGRFGGIDAVLNGMRAHAHVPAVQEYGCVALDVLALNSANQERVAAAGGIEVFVYSFRRRVCQRIGWQQPWLDEVRFRFDRSDCRRGTIATVAVHVAQHSSSTAAARHSSIVRYGQRWRGAGDLSGDEPARAHRRRAVLRVLRAAHAVRKQREQPGAGRCGAGPQHCVYSHAALRHCGLGLGLRAGGCALVQPVLSVQCTAA